MPASACNRIPSAAVMPGSCPTPAPKVGFEIPIVNGDGEDVGAPGCRQVLTQIAGGQKRIAPIVAIEQQNVDGAEELAVLKAVVQDMGRSDAAFMRVVLP